MAVWILYDPLAGGNCRDTAEALEAVIDDEVTLYDITKVTNYAAFLAELTAEDRLVIVGGDGTLHRFANDTARLTLLPQVCYYPCGTGNDLARDLGATEPPMPFPVGDCLRGLPEVEIEGRRRLFLNAVGFGADGYCCLRSEKQRGQGKEVNYAAIAVGGLLGRFRPVNAAVTVDGVSHSFQKVWLAQVLHGRYCGGMLAAPQQCRGSDTLSLLVVHSIGALGVLRLFPQIFSGRHVRHRRQVSVLTGREITVCFDCAAPLQIDGEPVPDVKSYTARADALKAALGL